MQFIDSLHDTWRIVAGEDGPSPRPKPTANRLLTLAQWHAVRETWPADLNTGVVVPNDTDIESLVPDLPKLSLVVLQFPKWTDGRAYTQAHLLRQRYGYQGQIRATGEVVVDMMPLLDRTGFDAVQLRGDQKREYAERALGFFSGQYYQGDVEEPRPVFQRDETDGAPAGAQA